MTTTTTGETEQPAVQEEPAAQEQPAVQEQPAAQVTEHLEEEPAAEESEAPAVQESGGTRRWLVVDVRKVVFALLAVALVACAWTGVSWWRASGDDAIAQSARRDQAVHAGVQAIVNLNTLDYRTAAADLALWDDSVTGQLRQQLTQGRDAFLTQIAAAKTATRASVVQAALTDLDERTGSAHIIAAVQLTVSPAQGQPVTKRVRLSGQLTLTAQGWKLSALGTAPTGVGR